MAGLMDQLISGVIKSAMGEILKKGLGKSTTTKRTKRKISKAAASDSQTSSRATNRRKKAGCEAGSGSADAAVRTIARKQVSRRKTSASRSKAKSG